MPAGEEKRRFSIVKRAKSFTHAGRGIWIVVKTTHNMWIHLVATVIVIALGFSLRLTSIEWTAIAFAVGFVLVAEALNTAIEIDIDLTSPEQHPYARDTKDVAAGAVFIAALTAVLIGVIIFGPHLAAVR